MDARFHLVGLALSSVTAITSAFGQPTEPPAADIPIISVCEALQDLAKYNGKTVVIVGRFASTMEGTWLGQKCERKIVTDGYVWNELISLAYTLSKGEPPPALPNDFEWDEKRLKAKLEEVRKTTKLQVVRQEHYRDKWVAMFGRFETHVPPQVGNRGVGTPMGNGFGHLNAAPAQLISSEKGFHELKGK